MKRLFILLALLMAPCAHAEWRIADWYYGPDTQYHRNYISRWVHAETLAVADCFGVFGGGTALDINTLCEAQSMSVAVGQFWITWRHVSQGEWDKVGEVEYKALLEQEGAAHLIDADCAGQATGSQTLHYYFDSPVPTCTARTILDESGGETKKGKLVSIGGGAGGHLGGPSLSFGFDINFGYGEGTYRDRDAASIPFDVKCPVTMFKVHTKTEVVVKVWANEFWGWDALVEVGEWGFIAPTYQLLCWPYCP
ncbi:MAG: hypothetical protein HY812_11660 [Planctomycetes bacterium]|nr:hypothetical protein [Planctomycetota bacterium]